jgi:S-DNA-T family DNA segregation ATPase FtsK/SpoIIIE
MKAEELIELKQAILITINNGSGSTSLLQRKMRLGYNKAFDLMNEMERLGVVGKPNGAIPRELLIKSITDIQLD